MQTDDSDPGRVKKWYCLSMGGDDNWDEPDSPDDPFDGVDPDEFKDDEFEDEDDKDNNSAFQGGTQRSRGER